MQVRKFSILAGALFGGLVFTSGVRAAIIASDSASNSPYVSGSDFNTLNGGTGFGPWIVTDVENPPAGGSTSNNGGTFINGTTNDTTRLPAPIFDVYDNGNAPGSSTTGSLLGSSIETAERPFLVSLTAGGSFTFTESLASLRGMNAGAATSQFGFELLDASGNVLLNLYCNGGGPGFFAIDAAHPTGYELAATDSAHVGRALTINSAAADTITFTLGTDGLGDYSIVTSGHEGSTFADGSSIDMSTGGPAAFAIYDNNGGYGSDIRVNNLSETAIPEPATFALAGLALSTLLLRRRRTI